MAYSPSPFDYPRSLILLVALLMTACGGGNPGSPSGGGNSGSGSSGSGGTTNRGTVTAIVDGVDYTGTINAASVNEADNLQLESNNAALKLSYTLPGKLM